MISEKKRLENALFNIENDRPPCICPGGMMNMITNELMHISNVMWPTAHKNAEQMAKLARSSYEQGCFENFGVPFCMTVEAEALGSIIDMGTEFYEPHVIKYGINTVSDWEKLNKLDFNIGRTKVILDAINILKNETTNVPIIGNLTGPISVATSLLDPNVFFKELRKNKENCHKFLKYISEQIMQFGIKQIEAGADVITISDPSATGEILGPVNFREYVVPYLNYIINGIRKKCGVGIIVHICGRMKLVYKELINIESNALSFDSLVNIKDIINNLPNKVIMGNVNTFLLESGTKDKIKSTTLKCIDDGVKILSPACGLGTKSSIENIKTMLKTVKEKFNYE